MAYSNGASENARLVLRTLRGAADFSGRSRRTEVVYYMIASALFNIVLWFALSGLLTWDTQIIGQHIVGTIISLPMIALFVRRLHDQDRSGSWLLLLLVVEVLQQFQLFSMIRAMRSGLSTDQSTFDIITWIGFPAAIGLLVLFFWSGTVGPNRYGPDPREAGEG